MENITTEMNNIEQNNNISNNIINVWMKDT